MQAATLWTGELSETINRWMKEPRREIIRTVNFKIEGGVSATLASNIIIRESNLAKKQGWEQVLVELTTTKEVFKVTLTGVKI
jgi:hypothetical protein